MIITAKQLKLIAPKADNERIEAYLPHFNHFFPLVNIDTRLRLSAFIAQLMHESGALRHREEIASGKAYEGRKDLGNVFPGDGVKFKGRGPIQITGRINYQTLSRDLFGDLRLLDEPELVAGYKVGTQAACWFWSTRKLNLIADKDEKWRIEVRKGIFYDRFQYITLRINGGQNGYADRLIYYRRALAVFA